MMDETPKPPQTPSKLDDTKSAPPAQDAPQQPLNVVTMPSQPVRPPQAKRKRRWPVVVLVVLLVAALAGGGWFFYNRHHDTSKKAVGSNSHDIPILKIGIESASYGELYPEMSPSSYSFLTNAQMFEGLVRYENKSNLVPALATNWSNPDSKTWIFTLRKDVKFHDGHTMTAKDVKYSLDKITANETSDLTDTFASTISSVDVVDGNKVKITTKEDDPTLLNRLNFLYIIDSDLPAGQEPSMAGTGPYMIKPGTKPSDTNVQMVAFDQYHGGRPKVRALSFGNEDSDSALLKAFKNGTYNIIGAVPVSEAKSVKGATEFISAEPDVNFLGFNTVKPGPLQNKQVREAVRYAVDPAAIGKARGNEITLLSQMIPESIPGYNPAIMPYKRDVAKAKKLLADAGYPNGLTLRLSTTDSDDAIKAVTDGLEEAGINVSIDKHPDFDEFINYFSNGQAEMYTVDYSSDTLDGLDIYTTTLDSANYDNPKLTALLDQAGQATDPAKRLKLLQDAAVVIDQDVAVVPLSTENDIWLMDRNYAIKQDMPSSFMSVYFYKVHTR